MTRDVWLPRGHRLKSGSRITTLRCCGRDWQIFDSDGPQRILLVRPELAEKWIACGLLTEAHFTSEAFGKERFMSLESDKDNELCSLEEAQGPRNLSDALAFALALKESRRCAEKLFFHDAIYVEQYSRLLPTWTECPPEDDETVLGTWLTGGVRLSATTFRRMAKLTGWLEEEDLKLIAAAAGLFRSGEDVEATGYGGSGTDLTQPSEGGAETAEDKTEKGEQTEGFHLPGRLALEKFFNEHVIDIILNPTRYAVMGIDFPSAIVLYGPPGCGKTYAVERLVDFLGWPSYSIDSGSVGSPYIHETGRKIAEVFNEAMNNAPSVLIIDEMEAYLSRRGAAAGSTYHFEELAEFLRRIPEASQKKVLVIAMTNLLETIDPAILRRGRFDHIVEVGMPTCEEVASLAASLLKKLPAAPDLDLSELIATCSGKALSDTTFIIREASRIAAKHGRKILDQESLNLALAECCGTSENSLPRIGFI